MTTPASAQPQRFDPLEDLYFKWTKNAEKYSQILFYGVALLSFGILFVEKNSNYIWYQIIHILFIVSVIALFFLSLVIRVYWFPRAEDHRVLDLLSHAFLENLSHEQSINYYNNSETDPIRRLGASTLENSLFSRSIISKMLFYERIKFSIYFVAFIVVALIRSSQFDWLEVSAQVVFSENIISYWLRLEWLHFRCEKVYEALYALFQTGPCKNKFHSQVLRWVLYYETSKANANITLSSKIFNELNPTISAEWNKIQQMMRP